MRVAFATCAMMPAGSPDDDAAAALLGAERPVWSDPAVDWERYNRVLPRSTWDYSGRIDEFLAWAARVGPARLRNPPELIAWNADKRYLAELPVPIVPTTFVAPADPLPALGAGEVVVKPSVSAGARHTGRFRPDGHDEARTLIGEIQAAGKTALVQPYQASIDTHGEAALVFIAGTLSHTMRKRAVLESAGVAPVTDDEIGVAKVMLADDLMTPAVATQAQKALGERLVAHISGRFGTPLYARIDLVHDAAGDPVVMELELLEPSLFFEGAPGAAELFAAAVRAS